MGVGGKGRPRTEDGAWLAGSAVGLLLSDKTELPSAVVLGPRLSYTGSNLKGRSFPTGEGDGALLHEGTRGRRGMVT